ncbi:MAG: capsule biosynthesis protein CapA [Rhodobacterales bacterium]|nr:MAG: capsule biosynthesis protein CapA [Rhodobacterales bacterium]
MPLSDAQPRSFLFLQGPHGPFFRQLARMLRAAGASCWRVGFNRGDEVFWGVFRGEAASYIRFTGAQDTWGETFARLLDEKSVTDIVLYGDTRFIHKEAVRIAKARGLTVHVFEEGYLRPYWVSYERGGSNGNSRLMRMSIAEMQAVLAGASRDTPVAPAHWGDMRQHIFYGALYHWFVMFWNRPYRGFRPHRDIPVTREFALYLRRLLLMPVHALERRLATRRVTHGGFPYHLVLLQLAHDSSFTAHSPFTRVGEFLEAVIAGFAAGAPRHHHLVFKAHPLEDGREPLPREIRRLAARYGVADRVHHLRGGKLARLLDQARSAVTVNSTAAQQALWRGLPTRVFGRAVFAKPELVSTQPVAEFFAHPARPDARAYRDFRAYLLETSQVAGGFYAARSRRQLLRQVVDMMLAEEDAYDALARGTAAPRLQLHAVT